MPATAKPTIKIVRIMIYLPEETTVPEDLEYAGQSKGQFRAYALDRATFDSALLN
jgi:hypothetical protein